MSRLTKLLSAGTAFAVTLQPSLAAAREPDIGNRAVLLVAHSNFREPMWRESVLLAAPLAAHA